MLTAITTLAVALTIATLFAGLALRAGIAAVIGLCAIAARAVAAMITAPMLALVLAGRRSFSTRRRGVALGSRRVRSSRLRRRLITAMALTAMLAAFVVAARSSFGAGMAARTPYLFKFLFGRLSGRRSNGGVSCQPRDRFCSLRVATNVHCCERRSVARRRNISGSRLGRNGVRSGCACCVWLLLHLRKRATI